MEFKNIVFIGKSLDGFIADKNGGLEWLNAIPNPDNHQMGYGELMEEIDAVVIGRTTFETVCEFDGEWPYHKHVFVLSSSIKELEPKYSGKVTLLSGTPKEDLIDELIITTIPILLGGGFPLFDSLPQELNFSHRKTEIFLDQIVQSNYDRIRD